MASISWTDVGKKVADFAPLLGTALGGPAGAALGAIVASTLGTGASASEVLAAVTTDPTTLAKLKELEYNDKAALRGHVLGMAQNDTELAKAEMLDQQQARTAHKDHWMPSALTMLLALMTSAVTYGVLTIEVPGGSKEVAFFIVGQILTAFITAVSFWLGSSRSSLVKDKLLGDRT